MENEILEKIKKEYKDIGESLNSNFREINRLEDNQFVKRYNYLKGLKEQVSSGCFDDSKSVLDYCIEKHGYGKVRQTNEIWLFMFECPIRTFERMFNIRLIEEDKSKIIEYYTDIENKAKHAIVLKGNQEEFERKHNIITGKKDILDYIDRYNNARHEFFISCVEEGQNRAVKMILEKYKTIF